MPEEGWTPLWADGVVGGDRVPEFLIFDLVAAKLIINSYQFLAASLQLELGKFFQRFAL